MPTVKGVYESLNVTRFPDLSGGPTSSWHFNMQTDQLFTENLSINVQIPDQFL